MNNLMVFEGKEVEVFEFEGKILFNPKHVAECLDIKNVNENLRNMNEKQVIKLTNSKINSTDFRKLHNTGENFLTESGIYKLIFKSRKEEAERFQDWVADEVLPNIRKHGGYLTNSKIEEILSNPDTIIRLATDLKEERAKRKQLEEEVVHKEDVIIGLVEDISLAEKRQRINQIVKYKAEPKNFSKRWNLLYNEFEKKYHLDLKRRIDNCDIKPKIKNKIDYIEREMNMIPQLYEIVCKLFENDVEELKKEWISTIEEKVC